MMPGFDREIAKLAQRVLINPRSIDFHTGVLASKVIPGPNIPAHDAPENLRDVYEPLLWQPQLQL